jgi:DNA-binding transcriptional LysR family regulator
MENDQLLAALHQQQIDVAIGYVPLAEPIYVEISTASPNSSVLDLQEHPANSPTPLPPGTNWVTIQSEKIWLALPASPENSPEQTSGPPTAPESTAILESIAGKTLILPPHLWDRNDGRKQVFLDLLKSRGIEPNNIREVADRETALSFVANNLGVTIIPSSMGCLEKKGIIYQELSGDWRELEIMAIWKSGNRSASLGSFITAIGSLLIRT